MLVRDTPGINCPDIITLPLTWMSPGNCAANVTVHPYGTCAPELNTLSVNWLAAVMTPIMDVYQPLVRSPTGATPPGVAERTTTCPTVPVNPGLILPPVATATG